MRKEGKKKTEARERVFFKETQRTQRDTNKQWMSWKNESDAMRIAAAQYSIEERKTWRGFSCVTGSPGLGRWIFGSPDWICI